MIKHHVTVENGILTKFECVDSKALCHTYPACECEEWVMNDHAREFGAGHELVKHEDCWMKGWFDNPESTSYNGDDGEDGEIPAGLTRAGYIATDWQDCIGWYFIDAVTS